MATKEKKTITEKTAIKAIITSYVCYGLLTFFMFNLIKSSVSSAILRYITLNLSALGYLIPTIFGILSLCIIHLLCRISTIDVFKKCSMDTSKTSYVMKNLKIFFVIVILFSIFYSFITLAISINLDLQAVNISSMQYRQVFSTKHTQLLTEEMIENFNNFRDYAFKDTFISEAFFVVGFISLSSFQRKMLETYNGKEPKSIEKINKKSTKKESKKEEKTEPVVETVTEAEEK